MLDCNITRSGGGAESLMFLLKIRNEISQEFRTSRKIEIIQLMWSTTNHTSILHFPFHTLKENYKSINQTELNMNNIDISMKH